MTTEEFIKKAREAHGDKYDYSETEYINSKTKVKIICPEHGVFEQTPYHHLNGHGCRKCQYKTMSNKFRMGIDEWKEKANKVHGNKYDYSNVDLDNRSEGNKVCIICPEHGEFHQTPISHMSGKGCPKCGRIKANKSESHTNESFIEKASKIHGDKYDYSKLEYKSVEEKVCIICPKHGEFWQIAKDHLRGSGCPNCKKETLREIRSYSKEEFIEKANTVHNGKYDYSKVEYVNSTTKVCIICPEHGEFWQSPSHHLMGVGCPLCKESKMEIEITKLLRDNGINHIRQYQSDFLGKLSLDFFLPDYNIAIECQGEQHYEIVEHFGGVEKFEKTKERDNRKHKICNEHDIKILYFSRKKYDENIITDKNKLLNEIKNAGYTRSSN